MRKAFLCHASKDKGYVEIVAKKLGRAKVVFDAMHFAPGEDFRNSIQSGLDETRVFVFLVSRSSLESVWCKYEVDEAAYRKLNDSLERCLTIIIDRDVRFSDLPAWLQRSKAVIQTRPSQAVRDIQHALFATALSGEVHPFVGRQPIAAEFARSLAEQVPSPHVLLVSGLEGIGRRSYLQRVTNDNLALQLGPFFLANETHDLTDVYLWALDETSEFGSRVQLADETRLFSRLTMDEQVREIVTRLHIMSDDGCLPCFVDQGGLLDNSGAYRAGFVRMIEQFLADHHDCYLSFIHRRKPYTRDLAYTDLILHQRISPLELHETKLLFSQLLRRTRTEIPSETVITIAEYLDGYAPAVYFAATYVSEYGLDALAADSRTLSDFKAKRFLRFLSELHLSDLDWLIAQYLAAEQMLPIEAIAVAFNHATDNVVTSIRNLIDHNLVVVVDDKYRIAGPIRDTLHRSRGYLSAEQYAAIRANLTKAFWSSEPVAPSVEVVDATLHAVAMSGSSDFNPYQDLVRVSTIHRLANECYHRKEWKSAFDYATRVEALAPERTSVRHITFKSLVQMERWAEAAKVLDDIRDTNDRLSFYLEGFMLRKQRKYREACKAFQSGLDAGDDSFPLHRDYADCLNRIGEQDKALRHVKWVLDRDSENIYVLDLMCRICIEGERLDEAKSVLANLERCDVENRFIHHRRASWYAAQRDFQNAVNESSMACQTGYAPFEAHALRCASCIDADKLTEAETELQDLAHKFGKAVRRDVQNGLRTKLLTKQGRWREALIVWEQLEDATTAVHRVLRARILQAKAKDESLSLSERETAIREAKEIETAVRVEDDYRVWAEETVE